MDPDAWQLKCAMWNVNGLGDKRGYIKQMLTEHKLDVLILTENKRSNAIYLYFDLDFDENEYRAIQILLTAHKRGGVVIILKKILRIETAEMLRPQSGKDFTQGAVIVYREGQALVFCYCAPTLTTQTFGTTLERLLREYNVQIISGDYNARHTAWCSKHDDKKRER